MIKYLRQEDMEVETPFLDSESDKDEELLDSLCAEEQLEHDTISSWFSGVSSSSSSSEEEEECYDSKRFLERLAINPCISAYELEHLVTAPRITPKMKGPEKVPMVIATDENRITDEDRKRRLYHIKTKEASVEVVFENYVCVSYLCNVHTGAPYPLVLPELAIKMLPYGVSFTKSKFTKITLKNLGGPSHYLSASGVCVESGSYSEAIGYKMHYNTMCILRSCGLESFAVKKRRCENIVAKGTVNFKIHLPTLRQKYLNYVKDNVTKFPGVIIRVNKIDAELNESRLYTCREADSDNDDDDSYHSNSNSSTSDEKNESDDDDDDDSYEYYEETPYEKKTCHPDFDYKKVVDREKRRENEILLRRQERESDYRMPQRSKEMLNEESSDGDEFNDYSLKKLRRKKNVTMLVFPKGRLICAGCKTTKDVLKTYAKVVPIVATCIDKGGA